MIFQSARFAYFLSIACLIFAASAAQAEGADAKKSGLPMNEDMRCEKMNGVGLAEFKERLIENCDLSKPFSSSMSQVLNNETYFYCCRKR